MEIGLFLIATGLCILGIVRYLIFKLRLRRYNKTKALVSNINIETRFFSSDGTEITKESYDFYSQSRGMYKKVNYYSPEITYHAEDGQDYTGNWWTEMPDKLPYNIGEKIEIYYNPARPGKFFLYDKVMMFWEPLLLVFIGLCGMVFMFFYL